jgi:hypothetical protein
MNGSFSVSGGSGRPGIGSGCGEEDDGTTVHTILIEDGNITSNGTTLDSGPGIGSSSCAHGKSTIESLVVMHGAVTASGGGDSAGIGSGHGYHNGRSTMSRLAIVDGVVSATGGLHASGIGSGCATDGANSYVEALIIAKGTISATSGNGASAIGSGYAARTGRSYIGDLTIENGVLTVNGSSGPAGIGGSDVDRLTIGSNSGNVAIDCVSSLTRACVRASHIVIQNSPIDAVTGSKRFLSFSRLSFSNDAHLLVKYRYPSEFEGIAGSPLLHLSLVSVFEDEHLVLNISDAETSGFLFNRRVPFQSSLAGLMMTVLSNRQYLLSYSSDSIRGKEVPCLSNKSELVVNQNEIFYDVICPDLRRPEFANSTESRVSAADVNLDGNKEDHPKNVRRELAAETSIFSDSAAHQPSIKFTESDEFKATNKFSESSQFTNSLPMTQSMAFEHSSAFTETRSFHESSEFSHSAAHQSSIKFTESDEFKATDTLSESSQFANSLPMTQSMAFEHSTVFESTLEFNDSSVFEETLEFNDSFAFNESLPFLETMNISASERMNETYDFNASLGFIETFRFEASSTFSPAPDPKESSDASALAIGLGIGFGALALIALAGGVLWTRRKKDTLEQDNSPEQENHEEAITKL